MRNLLHFLFPLQYFESHGFNFVLRVIDEGKLSENEQSQLKSWLESTLGREKVFNVKVSAFPGCCMAAIISAFRIVLLFICVWHYSVTIFLQVTDRLASHPAMITVPDMAAARRWLKFIKTGPNADLQKIRYDVLQATLEINPG